MSFYKLFKLQEIGFSEKSFLHLMEFFKEFGKGSIVSYADLAKNTRQKSRIDDMIQFLLKNNFLEDLDETVQLDEKKFRITIEVPETNRERKAKQYLENTDLYNQTREMILKKLESMYEKEKIGWILFIDFANSSTKFDKENILLKKDIIRKTFELASELLKKYISNYYAFELSNSNKGDEAEFYFFDEKKCNSFTKEFLEFYHKNIFPDVKQFNLSRNIRHDVMEKLYLKIFKAHSITSEPFLKLDNSMPSFRDMDAIILIKKIEKPIKDNYFSKQIQYIIEYFYVSDKQETGLAEIEIDTDIGKKKVYYKIH